MSSLSADQEQKWVPTHVQVTVLRARGLRGKGKHGTSDAYTIIQLAKEKYSTCVVEKTTAPEWREECSFELQPGVLDGGSQGGSNQLVLTVMHQALMGLDLFLGQAVVSLEKVFSESRCLKNEWYQLKSKTGKKEKERGDIQVTVQFTRDNLTASMYDLVMKDKSMSTFGKLKERMRGKRRSSEEDSSSAIQPGGYGSLCRMRQRLPSEGGGEEDYEDDEGGEVRRSKMRTFFLRGKLRKSSDTRSSTSLGSESSESSSRGGSLSPTAGISVVVSDLSNSPSNSSNLTTDNSPEHTANLSPRSPSSLQCEFGDEAGEISIAVPQPNLCVNGSHAYSVPPPDPGSGTPPTTLGLGLLHKSLPMSTSLQNLGPRAPTDPSKGPAGDGRRWSFDKPGEEEKAAIAAALEQSGPMLAVDEINERLGLAKAASVASEAESQGKKQKRNLFSHGRADSAGKGQSQRAEPEPAAEEKYRGWFGSKDSHSKLSLVVSPKVEPSTHFPSIHPPSHPPLNPPPPGSPMHHTNPFSHSQSTPPPISPCNPFFSLLQQNPFYDNTLTAQPLKSPLPPLPYLSSSRPPISHLFPRTHDPNEPPKGSGVACCSVYSDTKSDGGRAGKRPLPPTPAEQVSRRPSNPFTPAGGLDPDSQWDDSFEAFAAGRLQPAEGLAADRKTPREASEGPPDLCGGGGGTSCDPPRDFGSETRTSAGHLTSNLTHFDGFAQFLETIPEHNDGAAFDDSAAPLRGAAHALRNHGNTNVQVHANTDLGPHHPPAGKLNSSSPDPASSGIGSSVEEDFLSCLSSYSDKFSASSAEESEAPTLEADAIAAEKPRESVGESVESVERNAVLHRKDGVPDGVPDGSVAPQHPPVMTRRRPAAAPGEGPEPTGSDPQTESEDAEGREEFHIPAEDFPPADVPQPTFHVVTSSPDVERRPEGRLSPLGGFPISPGGGFDDLLLAAPLLELSGGSFLQSLYVSSDSQHYQTCRSGSSSQGPHSANSTLRGEPADLLLAADAAARELFPDAPAPSREDIHGPECSSDALLPEEVEPGSDPRGKLQRRLTDAPLHAASDGAFSKSPHAQTLQRSHSEGSLNPTWDERPSADSPPLTSSAPLTPDRTSFPLALCSLPPLANAAARSPPSAPQAAAPDPLSLESPQQQQQQQQQAANQRNSPHPVRPLPNATQAEERRTEGRSVLATGLEKLKSTIHPGRSSQLSEQEADRRKLVTGGAGSYYHLNHSELVALLVRRETELEEQKEEFERQKTLLAKREVELRRLKPQVKDLEDYIDTLLVRIMEQKPTLLQVRSKFK